MNILLISRKGLVLSSLTLYGLMCGAMEQQPAQNLNNGYVTVTLDNHTQKNLLVTTSLLGGEKRYGLDSGATVRLPETSFSRGRMIAGELLDIIAVVYESIEVQQAEPQEKKLFLPREVVRLIYSRTKPDPQGNGKFNVRLRKASIELKPGPEIARDEVKYKLKPNEVDRYNITVTLTDPIENSSLDIVAVIG